MSFKLSLDRPPFERAALAVGTAAALFILGLWLVAAFMFVPAAAVYVFALFASGFFFGFAHQARQTRVLLDREADMLGLTKRAIGQRNEAEARLAEAHDAYAKLSDDYDALERELAAREVRA